MLVVGAGLTGAAAVRALRKVTAHALPITVWEKARGAGGRASTVRSDKADVADLGAQYVTQQPSHDAELYDGLLEAGVLQPLGVHIEGKRGAKGPDFVAPQGMSSLVRYMLGDVEVHYGRRLKRLSVSEGGWVAEAEDGTTASFARVLLTMPVPQVLELEGDDALLDALRGKGLEDVEYSSRFVSICTFRAEDARAVEEALPRNAYYLPSTDKEGKERAVRWVSRGLGGAHATTAPTLSIHSSIELGRLHDLAGKDTEERARVSAAVGEALWDGVKAEFPTLPAPQSTRVHWWRYSQVVRASPSISSPALLASAHPRLVVAGDGVAGESNFDACVRSGSHAAALLLHEE
jgi:renalase